jgi:type I restriction enzyme R subunit
VGQRYLIQHSAGSGKSNTIAWLALQLSTLHDDDDHRIFDSIIVITDRRILDRQLQNTLGNFITTKGVLENIDKTSRQLKQALEHGKTVIVTTLQKFPVILDQIGELPGKKFAVIVDEAHSSQSGESARQMNAVLSTSDLDEAEKQDEIKTDFEDEILEDIAKHGPQKNVSMFAFTATPKPKTLEMFGIKQPDGSFSPFSLYTMRQAIEERFILDVLDNYTTYQTYFYLLKKIEDDPEYDRDKAKYLLKQFVGLDPRAIGKKVAIMIEHFVTNAMPRIGGKAKAMIVTSSRLHAVRYRLAVDQYLKEHNYPFKALVAFSGEVNDSGKKYTEANMNGFPERQTADTFKGADYRFLIVANKFQTGFDQPLLHSMYVDRRLSGVQCVQTLSRLNRVHAEKKETMVLDFVNGTDDIQKAFQPFYERTLLEEGTDPNLLYDLQTEIMGSNFILPQDIEAFVPVFWSEEPLETKQPKIRNAVKPAEDRAKEADKPTREEFRSRLVGFVRLYAFLSQILPFKDADLEKFYRFARALLPFLKEAPDRLPVEVQDAIDMESYRIDETSAGKIGLGSGPGILQPRGAEGSKPRDEAPKEPLSAIIEELNKTFGTDFSEEDALPVVKGIMDKLEGNAELEKSLQVSAPDAARLAFNQFVDQHLQDYIQTNLNFYKKLVDDDRAGKTFKDRLFSVYRQSLDRRQASSSPPEATC